MVLPPTTTRDDRRGQRLGQRRELEDGVRVDGPGLPDPSFAEALEVDDTVLVDDGHRDARNARRLHAVLDDAIELADGVVHVRLRELRWWLGRWRGGSGGGVARGEQGGRGGCRQHCPSVVERRPSVVCRLSPNTHGHH
jgi:hypothetical protein